MTNVELLEKLAADLPGAVEGHEEFRGELTLVVRPEQIVRVATHLRNALGFNLLVDAYGIDWYRPNGRFDVVYNVYALEHRRYVRLKVAAEEEHPVVPTLTGVWPGANWHERETFDMFGIKFEGHPDLRRMYMPEEFEHHPLRKDFPLMGIPDSIPLPRR